MGVEATMLSPAIVIISKIMKEMAVPQRTNYSSLMKVLPVS